MEALFLNLMRMSMTAGWMILAVMAARPFLKKAPRSLMCLLWGLASLRLLFPVTLESRVSLVPTQTVLQEGIRFAAQTVEAAPVAVKQISVTAILAWVWLAGMVLIAGYAMASYFRLRRWVQISLRAEKNVYLCDNIPSPFILGVFRPRIYLPSSLTEEQARFVLAHERAHLSRGDHLWKPLGYMLLCVYWFNPLCWAAYILFCRDMELACDERVVRPMEKQDRSAYSSTLLECSIRGKMISACPLAFGEVGVKARIRSVLNYRKPAAWVVGVSCLICAVVICCFLTDPVQAQETVIEGIPCIVTENTALRDAPEGKIVGNLNLGQPVTVQDEEELPVEDGTWVKVYSPDAKKNGWVESGKLNGIKPCGPATFFSAVPYTVYSAPGETAKAVGELKPEEAFDMDQQLTRGTPEWVWIYGTCRDQQISGWIKMYLSSLEGEETPEVTQIPVAYPIRAMAVTSVNVRSAPSTSSRASHFLVLGDKVTIEKFEIVAGITWAYVRMDMDGSNGWVLAEYLTQLEEDTMDAVQFDPGRDSHDTGAAGTSINLYSSPSHQARIVASLEEGEGFTVLRRDVIAQAQWCYVRSEDGMCIGWVETSVLFPGAEEETAAPAGADDMVTVSTVSLMSSPARQARTIATLEAGTKLTILQREMIAGIEWCYITCEEPIVLGWLEAENLTAQPAE